MWIEWNWEKVGPRIPNSPHPTRVELEKWIYLVHHIKGMDDTCDRLIIMTDCSLWTGWITQGRGALYMSEGGDIGRGEDNSCARSLILVSSLREKTYCPNGVKDPPYSFPLPTGSSRILINLS
jgi:hypothetical protein